MSGRCEGATVADVFDLVTRCDCGRRMDLGLHLNENALVRHLRFERSLFLLVQL